MTGTTKANWFPWTDAQIATLRNLWKEGTSASQIAARLGRTKSAAIGKAHRLGLERRDNPVRYSTGPISGPGSGILMKEWWAKFWTEDKVEIARRGYTSATAQPVSIIATSLGCSMTTVMRFAKEQGWRHPGLSGSGMARKKFTVEAGNRAHRLPSIAPDSRNAPLADLQPRECRFPVTPHNARRHLFCGASIEGSPVKSCFCPFHHAVAYPPRTTLNEAA